jgi:hypothetical protein
MMSYSFSGIFLILIAFFGVVSIAALIVIIAIIIRKLTKKNQ